MAAAATRTYPSILMALSTNLLEDVSILTTLSSSAQYLDCLIIITSKGCLCNSGTNLRWVPMMRVSRRWEWNRSMWQIICLMRDSKGWGPRINRRNSLRPTQPSTSQSPIQKTSHSSKSSQKPIRRPQKAPLRI